MEHALGGHVLQPEDLPALLGVDVEVLVAFHVAADHLPDQSWLIDVAHVRGGDVVAVAQDRHPVADVEDLLQAVRDVDDGDAAFGESLHDGEQLLQLLAAQDGRRLVHDQDLAAEREGARGSGQLLQRDPQLVHPGPGGELDAEDADEAFRLRAHRGPVEDAAGGAELVA